MEIKYETFPAIMRQLGIDGYVLGQAQVLVLDAECNKSKPLQIVQADEFIHAIDALVADKSSIRVHLYTIDEILEKEEARYENGVKFANL